MKVEFREDHDNPTDSQLIICVTGEESWMRVALKEIIEQMEGNYNKPTQGTMINARYRTTVITPIWNGKKY